jgi:hypothetical protein
MKNPFTGESSGLNCNLESKTTTRCAVMVFRVAVLVLLFYRPADCVESLLYFEAQAVAGYSSRSDEVLYYSHMPEVVMQKPSIGLDYLCRLSGKRGDFGAFALQYRLAWDESDRSAEHQIYNAYFKYKFSRSDLWVGHNRPALGLSSYFDGHGLLLQTLPMNGFGFDRDWGIGSFKDFQWGNISFSITNGAGMPARFNGNYLAAARISKGFLNQDNYVFGASAGFGQTLMTMGYEVMEDDPEKLALAGVDAAYIWNRYEVRMDVLAGENHGENAGAVFVRGGINLLEEGRLKLEIQPVYLQTAGNANSVIEAGASFQATPDIAVRTLYQHDRDAEDHRVVVQVYLYKKVQAQPAI